MKTRGARQTVEMPLDSVKRLNLQGDFSPGSKFRRRRGETGGFPGQVLALGFELLNRRKQRELREYSAFSVSSC